MNTSSVCVCVCVCVYVRDQTLHLSRMLIIVIHTCRYDNETIRTHHANSNGTDPLTNAPFRVPEDLAPNRSMRDW